MGLFVREEGQTTGPAVSSALLGDKLTVQARVYNYSLANLPDGSEVVVQFYAQPWDASQAQFATGGATGGFAQAQFIGETTIDTIPAFCGGPQGTVDTCLDAGTGQRNLATAEVTWDTGTISPAPSSDTNWVFWVVAWAQDGSGNLLSELSQHGLKSKPGSTGVSSIAAINVETYGNNLGYYPQVITLFPPEQEQAPGVDAPDDLELVIDELWLGTDEVLRDRRATVRVVHRTTGSKVDSTFTELFLIPGVSVDGDPEELGELTDINFLPRIPDDGVHATALTFTPHQCGPHTLVAEANSLDGSGLTVVERTFIDVTIDVDSAIGFLVNEVWDLRLAARKKADRRKKFGLVRKLRDAGRAIDAGRTENGVYLLGKFNDDVEVLKRRGRILPEKADTLIAQSNDIAGCVW